MIGFQSKYRYIEEPFNDPLNHSQTNEIHLVYLNNIWEKREAKAGIHLIQLNGIYKEKSQSYRYKTMLCVKQGSICFIWIFEMYICIYRVCEYMYTKYPLPTFQCKKKLI